MDTSFVRSGPLMDVCSYPLWLQSIIHECSWARHSVATHEIFHRMSEGSLPESMLRKFLSGVWPVVEQFPQYMAMNLLKVKHGSRGHEMARKYLIRNIRVEQNHVEYWMDWAQAHDVPRSELLADRRSGCVDALSHWCWHTCERASLAVGMAATNYAIEGVTGEWAACLCASEDYENAFPPEVRKKAMKWLRVHAHYDDAHPWEALEVIATLLGTSPSAGQVDAVQVAISKSYEYMRLAFDDCMATQGVGECRAGAAHEFVLQRPDSVAVVPAA